MNKQLSIFIQECLKQVEYQALQLAKAQQTVHDLYQESVDETNVVKNITLMTTHSLATTTFLHEHLTQTQHLVTYLQTLTQQLNQHNSSMLIQTTSIQTLQALIQQALQHLEQTIKSNEQSFQKIHQALLASTQWATSAQHFLTTINAFVTTINDIASKTNILTINAAIITEKTSTNDEGFNIIAKEMQMLTEQTKISVGNIAQDIQNFSTDLNAHTQQLHEILTISTTIMTNFEPLIQETTKLQEQQQKIDESFKQISSLVEQEHQQIQELEQKKANLATMITECNQKIEKNHSEQELAMQQQQKMVDMSTFQHTLIKEQESILHHVSMLNEKIREILSALAGIEILNH